MVSFARISLILFPTIFGITFAIFVPHFQKPMGVGSSGSTAAPFSYNLPDQEIASVDSDFSPFIPRSNNTGPVSFPTDPPSTDNQTDENSVSFPAQFTSRFSGLSLFAYNFPIGGAAPIAIRYGGAVSTTSVPVPSQRLGAISDNANAYNFQYESSNSMVRRKRAAILNPLQKMFHLKNSNM